MSDLAKEDVHQIQINRKNLILGPYNFGHLRYGDIYEPGDEEFDVLFNEMQDRMSTSKSDNPHILILEYEQESDVSEAVDENQEELMETKEEQDDENEENEIDEDQKAQDNKEVIDESEESEDETDEDIDEQIKELNNMLEDDELSESDESEGA